MFYAVELLAAYPIERRLVAADVFREPVHLIDADVKHIAAEILNGNVILAAVLSGYSLNAGHVAHAVNFVYGEIAHFGSLKQIAPLAFYAFFLAGIEIHIARTDNDEFCRMINEARRQKITRYGGYAETKFGSVRTNARRAVSENFIRHFIRARRASATKNYLITGKFPVGYIAEKIVRLCRIPRDGRTFYVERFERIEEIYGGGYVL